MPAEALVTVEILLVYLAGTFTWPASPPPDLHAIFRSEFGYMASTRPAAAGRAEGQGGGHPARASAQMAFGDGSVKPLFGEDGLSTEFDVARIMRFDRANESLEAIRVSSVFGVFFNVDGPDLEWDLEHDRDR